MIKMFRMISGENILAEHLEETETCYVVKYPSIIFTVGNNTMILALPQYAKHYKEMMNRFEIPKRLIFFSDEAEDSAKQIYEQFCMKVREQMTGIVTPISKVYDKKKFN